MVSAFKWATKEGVLCSEPMRGIRFDLCDFELRVDAIHRGGGQIIPAARRLYYALELLGQPTLCEPIYLCKIEAPTAELGEIYRVLMHKRAEMLEEVSNKDGLLANVSYP